MQARQTLTVAAASPDFAVLAAPHWKACSVERRHSLFQLVRAHLTRGNFGFFAHCSVAISAMVADTGIEEFS